MTGTSILGMWRCLVGAKPSLFVFMIKRSSGTSWDITESDVWKNHNVCKKHLES